MPKTQTQVGIIGGGIIGVCTALYLQRIGYDVSIIDAKGIAKECSQGNAGHFATEQIFPLADKALLANLPKMLLDPLGPFRIKPSYFLKALPWFLRFVWQMRKRPFTHSKLKLKELNKHALCAFEELLAPFELDNLITLQGSILTFESTPDEQIETLLNKYLDEGVDVSWLSKEQILAIEPNLSENVTSAFLFNLGGHTADPEQLCVSLAEQFLAGGGQIIIDQIEDINTQDAVLLTGEMHSYHFDKIVVATGAWSKKLAHQLGYFVPLDTERGYHLMVEQADMITRPIASAERKFIMTPMSNGLRLAGTVEFAGLDAPLNNQRADILLPHAKSTLRSLPDAKISEPWMGFRPSLPDSLPVIGQAPRHSSVFFAFGHHHLGLTHGAITGKLIAEQMSGQRTTIDLAPFCISRFN
ncbi:NAD(P)/FAD-dependent oxidoreductase [Thalassotalea eurytherma]|uniref:Amino acid dehydrogenase n=1 Tax=Thalassotalea eurytherma TaxID=1144278 RepID=A0ABQ6H388_9GAMM|nr:FAD-binding oxidoreductase [Thalassotalea eurytherma]GLX82653.1 amino acid dehydrogenase [Thalassotalea eurytherma]